MAGFNANLGRDIGEPSLGGAAPTRVVFSMWVRGLWAKAGLFGVVLGV